MWHKLRHDKRSRESIKTSSWIIVTLWSHNKLSHCQINRINEKVKSVTRTFLNRDKNLLFIYLILLKATSALRNSVRSHTWRWTIQIPDSKLSFDMLFLVNNGRQWCRHPVCRTQEELTMHPTRTTYWQSPCRKVRESGKNRQIMWQQITFTLYLWVKLTALGDEAVWENVSHDIMIQYIQQ